MNRPFLNLAAVAFVLLIGAVGPARADVFDSVDGQALRRAVADGKAGKLEALSPQGFSNLPNVLRDARAPLLAVKTGKGNLARLLIQAELRKPAGEGKPIPVYMLEKFDVFDAGDPSVRLAKGRTMLLFPGFQVDLDTAQIVPEGEGGDLVYDAASGAVKPIGGATLYAFTALPTADPKKPSEPTPGRAVVPVDFAGRYRFFGNGQWSGTLELDVEGREVGGRFRSDTHGASYPVTGEVAADLPNKISFAIKFPRTRGEAEGYLWTDGKGAIAGTLRLNDRPFGFFAVREGGRFAPEDAETPALLQGPEPAVRIVVKLFPERRIVLGGHPVATDGLAAALEAALKASPGATVVLRPDGSTHYDEIERAVASLKSGGASTIRLAAPEP